MITIEQSNYLLGLSKKIEVDGRLRDKITFNQKFPFQERYTLISPEESDFIFLYEIFQSPKNQFKLSLYLMDDDTKIGLLRVDFNGSAHENPHNINDKVPEILKPYAGRYFVQGEPHIHYYVEGFKTTLDWALPIVDDSFPVKSVTSHNDVLEVFYNFNRIINLITEIQINPMML